METTETLVLVLHVLAALAIIGLVLIQHGKGADMGAGFGGGASATVFGSGGAGNFLTKLTTWVVVGFFLTSLSLAWFASEKSGVASEAGIPTVVEQGAELPAGDESELPAFEVPGPDSDSEIPEG